MGMRVDPPTRITWSISLGSRLASLIARLKGPTHFSRRSAGIFSKSARAKVISRRSGASGVAGGRVDLKYSLAYSENADVEGSSTEGEDQDVLIAFLVETVSQCSSRRL